MRGCLPAALLLFLAAAIAAAAGPVPEPAGPEPDPASLERPPSGPASGKDLPSVLTVIEGTSVETDADGDGVPDVSDCRLVFEGRGDCVE